MQGGHCKVSVHSVTKKAAGSLAEAHSTTGENKQMNIKEVTEQ